MLGRTGRKKPDKRIHFFQKRKILPNHQIMKRAKMRKLIAEKEDFGTWYLFLIVQVHIQGLW
jgi:hypothetical protein